ncbi:hypothetical protein [Bradyrhizobium sp. dw_78]|uniref:hypothetical protein n=1 Tax=Bradyrhizobium sp. dw_78 TaxID=2719793 RepID=UPI001BD504CE|nr:hypothetical protein [Bradyrhizobium sp. dw_78]
MANSFGTETPPAPKPGMTNALISGAMPSSQTAVSAGPGESAAQAAPPAPTHAQTVAVLRHTTAIAKELRGLLNLPELGKSSVKRQIIDGAVALVAERILTPAQAVSMLSTVPTEPLLQRKWAQSQLASNMAAMNNVLDHHSAAFPGTGDLATEMQRSQSNAESHFDDVNAALAHFPRGSRNE